MSFALSDKINVLMLNYEWPPIGGGAGQAHLAILKQFAGDARLRIDVLTSAPQPGFLEEKFAPNITIYRVGLHKKNLHFWHKMEVIEWLAKAKFHYRKLLTANKYHLAHAFFGFPTGYLCYKTADKLPYIISLRGSDVPGLHARLQLEYKLLAPLFRRIWKNAAAIVACSNGLKDRAHRFLPSVAIDVIGNGVELDRFSPAPNCRGSNREIKLLTVGRLSGTKRVDILIDAVELLHKQGLEVRFAAIGGGGLKSQLRQIVQDKGLGNIITITGRREGNEMPDVYRQNDIFISATCQEGMSNAMLEAMASGLPIITTRCEGVEELISDNGIVVDSDDATGIAGAVKTLVDDKGRYEAMRLAARRQADKFDWKAVAEQYIELYKHVTALKAG